LKKNPQNRKTPSDFQLSWNAPLLWVCFGLLLIGHLLLSFADLSTVGSIWAGVFLVALPFFLLVWAALESPRGRAPLYRQETFKVPGWPVWVLLAGLALGFRFYRLTGLSVWPGVDEGVHAFIAMELSRHWEWSLFHYCSQMPPFYFWLEAGLFKVLGPSLFSLWLLPALLSLVPFAFAYLESKRYFSKSFSFLLAFLLGLGFWPLFLGRFSHPAVLVFPWACLALAGLGRILTADKNKKDVAALVLGLLAGSGFYTYLSWAPVALFTAAVVAWKSRRARRPFWIFTAALVLSLTPLAWAMVQNGYGSYLAVHWPLSRPGGSLTLFLSPFRYLGALLWGGPNYYFYTSNWGGLLNPLGASLFWVGLAGLFRAESRKTGFFTLLALVLFLLPGVLTYSVNSLRVVQCLPVVLFCSTVGFQALAGSFPPLRRGKIIALVLLASVALDSYHLFFPFHFLWSNPQGPWPINGKSLEYSRAYPLLEEQNRRAGSGLVYTAFQPNWTDQSLTVATIPFNALLNPGLDSTSVRWVAWVCNIHYLPFLEKRFPEGRATWLSSGHEGEDGGLMLEIVPITGENRATWAQWSGVNGAFLNAVSVLMRRREGQSYDGVRKALLDAQPLAEGDPFLESCLWDQVFNSYNSDAAYGNRLGFKNFEGAFAALNQGLSKGYPNAYFYNERGSMEVIVGEREKAREDFKKALQCPLNKTSAADNLKALQQSKN
jgi:hypothetical protein